jgi:hypothetical protein
MQPARYLNGERRRRRQRYNEEEEDLTRFHFISVGGRPIYSTPHWANIPTGTDCRANNEQTKQFQSRATQKLLQN